MGRVPPPDAPDTHTPPPSRPRRQHWSCSAPRRPWSGRSDTWTRSREMSQERRTPPPPHTHTPFHHHQHTLAGRRLPASAGTSTVGHHILTPPPHTTSSYHLLTTCTNNKYTLRIAYDCLHLKKEKRRRDGFWQCPISSMRRDGGTRSTRVLVAPHTQSPPDTNTPSLEKAAKHGVVICLNPSKTRKPPPTPVPSLCFATGSCSMRVCVSSSFDHRHHRRLSIRPRRPGQDVLPVREDIACVLSIRRCVDVWVCRCMGVFACADVWVCLRGCAGMMCDCVNI